MEDNGILQVYRVFSFNPVNGNVKTKNKAVLVETIGCTRAQAKGWKADFEGMNPESYRFVWSVPPTALY